eukprot:scaffold710_cov171-Amphora_coffeaeformis.AAC.45
MAGEVFHVSLDFRQPNQAASHGSHRENETYRCELLLPSTWSPKPTAAEDDNSGEVSLGSAFFTTMSSFRKFPNGNEWANYAKWAGQHERAPRFPSPGFIQAAPDVRCDTLFFIINIVLLICFTRALQRNEVVVKVAQNMI